MALDPPTARYVPDVVDKMPKRGMKLAVFHKELLFIIENQ